MSFTRTHCRKAMCRSTVACALAFVVASSSVGNAYAIGVAPGSATAVQRDQAQQKFLRGRDFFNMKMYGKALEEFRLSMDIVQSPNTRLYYARTLAALGKLVEAYVELGRTAAEADELAVQDARYAKTGPSAQLERKSLEKKLAFVIPTVQRSNDDTKLLVGTEEIRRAGWSEPIPVMPGTVDVILRTPGHDDVKLTVTLAAGEKKSLTLDGGIDAAPSTAASPALKPVPNESSKGGGNTMRTLGWVSGAASVVGFATFATFGLMSQSKFSDLSSVCKPTCPPSKQSELDEGKRDQLIANIGLGVGIAGAAASVTFFLLGIGHDKPVAVAVTPTGIFVRGSFQ